MKLMIEDDGQIYTNELPDQVAEVIRRLAEKSYKYDYAHAVAGIIADFFVSCMTQKKITQDKEKES